MTEAGCETVAILVGDKPGLVTPKFDGAFCTGAYALAATIAFFLINTDYLSLRHVLPLLSRGWYFTSPVVFVSFR